jgi:hypothetical protein
MPQTFVADRRNGGGIDVLLRAILRRASRRDHDCHGPDPKFHAPLLS